MAKLATFQSSIFQDETKAREALEAVLWPVGPFCRHCGNSAPEKIAKMQGKSARPACTIVTNASASSPSRSAPYLSAVRFL